MKADCYHKSSFKFDFHRVIENNWAIYLNKCMCEDYHYHGVLNYTPILLRNVLKLYPINYTLLVFNDIQLRAIWGTFCYVVERSTYDDRFAIKFITMGGYG